MPVRVSVAFCVALAASLSRSSAWTSNVAGQSAKRPLQSRRFLMQDPSSAGQSLGATNLVHSRPRSRRKQLDMAANAAMVTVDRKPKRRRRRSSSSVALAAQRIELLDHVLLTKEEELELGGKVKRANRLRAAMDIFIQDKKAALQEEILREVYHLDAYDGDGGELSNEALLMSTETSSMIDVEDLSHFSILGSEQEEDDLLFDSDGSPMLSGDEISLENHFQNLREQGRSDIDSLDDRLLTDDDIVHGLNVKGGREALQRILLEGAFARDKLIRYNIRLVVSIAKRWARQSAKYAAEGGSLVSIYSGSTSRPSLDEAIQEGILGLARAADRYDPSRGLRFSTYSTYWVTNFVRNCFQDAATGSLRIPVQLHTIKGRYKALVKRCYETNTDIPPEDEIAKELGVSVNRLRTALLATRPLLSTDASVGKGPSRGSAAEMGGNDLMIADTLQCNEARPEDQVELTFLRQCLENAMAAELSPHERDVLRLRLGLDDGVSRTVREVVEVCGGTVSMSEVRLAEQRAYKKLRTPFSLQNHNLIAFLDFAGVDLATLKHM